MSSKLVVAAIVAWGFAAGAYAQAVLHPNQIVGRMRFTNANPEILAALDRATTASQITAVQDPLRLTSLSTLPDATFATQPFEVTVDTTDAGLQYLVQAQLTSARREFTYTSVIPTTP